MACPMPMAASRLLRQSCRCSSASPSPLRCLLRRTSSASPFRLSRRLSMSALATAATTVNVFPRRILFPSFRSLRTVPGATFSSFAECSSGSSACDDSDVVDGQAEGNVVAVAPHPWPEWELFLEKMKEKGYLEGDSSDAENGEQASGAVITTTSSLDYNRIKVACLSFARERFDLIKCFPKEDLKAVVMCGCPSTDRKPTNSGKRLRAHLMLNEKDVCGACSLQGSCDRANLLPKEEGARTVDILRIILCYAIDPNILSRFEVSQRKQIESSIRKLLLELIKLSDTVLDPTLEDPKVKNPSTKKQFKRSSNMGNNRTQNVEMKRGDWICSKCSFLNFSRNLRCLKCKTEGPKSVDPGDVEMKKGDWTCQSCQFMNFARNRSCKRCQAQRPPQELNPGEWECPSCYFLNYRRNRVCLKCNLERPVEEPNESAEHLWKKPDISTRKLSGTYQ